MDVVLRKARPEDACFLAWVMLTASRSHHGFGLWDRFVNANEQKCLAFLEQIAVTPRPHLFHHDLFMIMEKDGRPEAGLSGYDPATHGMRVFAKALYENSAPIGWSGQEIKTAFIRISDYGACMPSELPGVWTAESVAAVPQARRQGNINLLLHEILSIGRTRGYHQAQIAVLLGNTAARKAYEKRGFCYQDEKRDPAFAATYGDLGIARLRMDLFLTVKGCCDLPGPTNSVQGH